MGNSNDDRKGRAAPFLSWRSATGLRITAQYALAAALPVGLAALALKSRGLLTPDLARVLGAAGGAALVIALTWGVVHAALAVRRLERLTDTTRRIARQDFSVTLPVQGRGEVATIARAINDMAQHLGAALSVQQILAQMDDAILTKLDMRALIRCALRCMRLVTLAEVVVLGLFDSEDPESLHLFSIRKGSRNAISTQRVKVDAERLRRLAPATVGATAPESPLPKDYEDILRIECGVQQFLVLPVAQDKRSWGVMVTCHKAPAEFPEESLRLLGTVSARLIAGFSGAERDRKLDSLAYVDPLTGMPNRMALQPLLGAELANAQRSEAKLAVLFLDLDRFKLANDTHGHAIGDRLLVQAANRIRNNVREDDVVARSGGDEFTVILGNLHSTRDAASVTRKLIQSLSRRFEVDGKTIYTGASVGISVYPDDSSDGAELLKMADTAMYRAKSEGRSRFAFFEEPMNAESRRRSTLDSELRQALLKNEFVLHYQPQIDLRTGALFGVESLIRWQHPTRGLLYPKDFIEFAEEIGLIPEIGIWAMLAACRQHEQWRLEGARVPRVSVNVSNGQLPRSNFLASMRKILADTGMPPGALEIEVTESMLVDGGEAASEAIEQLAAEGVLIAIDDFGTGYSSFNYLKTMPAKVLKLDMSFLVGATVDNSAGKIVAAIVNMAHALQKEVVAEGVENIEQLKLLKQLGCERGQGYLFGKPVPADHIQRIFRAAAGPAGTPVAAPVEAAPASPPEPAPAEPPAAQAAPFDAPVPVALAERPAAPPPESDNRGEPATVPLHLAEFEEMMRLNSRA
jgi:diguanylate cyclase (GGDEF)-like protein